MADNGGWSLWLRNGRLATVALGVVFVSWLGFQLFKEAPPPLLDQILLYTVGVWFGNIAMETKRGGRSEAGDRDE